MLGWFLYLRLGYSKTWWLGPSHTWAPGNEVYWLPGGAMGLILLGIAIMLPTLKMRQDMACISAIYIPLMFIPMFWQPRFLTPAWLNWLRDNHADIMPALVNEVKSYHKNGTIYEWEARIATQEGLEAWAHEIRKKYGRLYDHEWKIAYKNPQLRIMAESDLVEAINSHPKIFKRPTIQHHATTTKISERPTPDRQRPSQLRKLSVGLITLSGLILSALWLRRRKRK